MCAGVFPTAIWIPPDSFSSNFFYSFALKNKTLENHNPNDGIDQTSSVTALKMAYHLHSNAKYSNAPKYANTEDGTLHLHGLKQHHEPI